MQKLIKDAVFTVMGAKSEDLDVLKSFEQHPKYEVYTFNIYPNPDQTLSKMYPHTLGWNYCVFKLKGEN